MELTIKEGRLWGQGFHFGIVLSRFNDFISKNLLAGAIDMLKRHGVEEGYITTYRVPGSFEIPLISCLFSLYNQCSSQYKSRTSLSLGSGIS